MHPHGERSSVIELMHHLFADARLLLRQEVALFRAESREQVRQLITIGALLLATAAALGTAALWLLVATTLGLSALFSWPVWGVCAGVGLVLAMVGIVLAVIVLYQVRAIEVLPKTRSSLREHARWTTRAAADRL